MPNLDLRNKPEVRDDINPLMCSAFQDHRNIIQIRDRKKEGNTIQLDNNVQLNNNNNINF